MSSRRRLRAQTACLALVLAGTLTSCSGSASHQTTTTLAAPPAARYSASGATVEIAFPSPPIRAENPPSFAGVFKGHTLVTTWSIGDIGLLKPGSYELAIVGYPPGTPGTLITSQLEAFGGAATTTLYGRPAIRTVNRLAGHYAAILAFSVQNVLIVSAAYDKTEPQVRAFTDSLRLISPTP